MLIGVMEGKQVGIRKIRQLKIFIINMYYHFYQLNVLLLFMPLHLLIF